MNSHLTLCVSFSLRAVIYHLELQSSDWCLPLAYFSNRTRANLGLRFLVGEDHKSCRNEFNLRGLSFSLEYGDVSFPGSFSDCTVSAQLQPSSACAGPVITCFYHRLVQAVRWHWEQWAHENKSPIKSKGMCESGTNLSKT